MSVTASMDTTGYGAVTESGAPLAGALNAEWTVVSVETSSRTRDLSASHP
jgi:hypothetical protein